MITALLIPGVPAMASTDPAAADGAIAADPQYYVCTIAAERTRLIVYRYPRPNNENNCPLGGELAFAALITHSSTSYTVKVCNHTPSLPFWEGVNQARPDGGATGNVFWYQDPAGGGCSSYAFPNPVRKFQASYDGHVSQWAAPY
jgi:hypothetical protein